MLKADICYYNGSIYTMEKQGARVEAIAVLNEKILFAGSSAEALKIPAGQTVNLEHAAVIPGFIDTHCHIAEVAEAPLRIDLMQARSIQDVLDTLAGRKNNVKSGEWIIACNLDCGKLREKRFPDRYELDSVSKDIPVFIHDIGLHNFICNSIVLELAGIDRGFDKSGSELLELDDDGVPTGVCHEHGLLGYLNAKRPSIFGTEEKALDVLYKVLKQCAGMGLTTVHTYDGFAGSMLDDFSAYQKLERIGRLPVRMILNRNMQRAVNNETGAVSGFGNEKIKYGAMKLFVDGTYAVRSAYLLEPYADKADWKGRLIHSPAELKMLMHDAYKKGNDIATHVIGDGAAELVLKIIEEIYDPENPCRFTMIHCHLVHESMRRRMAKLPVVAAMQPVFVSLYSTGTIEERLGAERAKDFHAFKSMQDAGVMVTGGSDAPCADQNPMKGIDEAVNRISFSGTVFQPQERVSVYDAVSFYTKNAAYCGHEEKIKGTITVGKLADFITLDKDIFSVKREDVGSVKVTGTYVGGRKIL
jgi:predicted amidohydrolase YtcJ